MRVHVSSRLPAVCALIRNPVHRQYLTLCPIPLHLQNVFGLGYEAEYSGRDSAVQTVIEDFAKRFSLPAKMCTAFHVGKKLDGNEMLLQVAPLVLNAANFWSKELFTYLKDQ